MTERSDPRPPARPVGERKPRPDPGPIRIAIGLTGMATATALVTAFLSPLAGATAAVQTTTSVLSATGTAAPDQAVRHVTRYVQLKPGQTAPPKAIVKQAPAPTPRVVVITTKQSGIR